MRDGDPSGRCGVLVMAYGTARDLPDVERYYTDIRGGRPPTPEQLADLTARYAAIGGVSPLWRHTVDAADALATELARRAPGRYAVFVGNRHSPPFVRDAVSDMLSAGVRDAVGLVLAPHYSAMSVGAYARAAADALGDPPRVPLAMVESWHMQAAFLDALARRVRDALALFPEGSRDRVPVLFTAHSLPQRILGLGDPYPDQLAQSAAAVADRLGIAPLRLAYQSAGRTPEPWLGPDLLEAVARLADEGHREVVVCPQGFVSDHLEVLYDVDVECRKLCDRLGMRLVRTHSMNDAPDFVSALADAVAERSGHPAG